MATILNRDKEPQLWIPDIETSVEQYNEWYRAEAPVLYAAAFKQASEAAAAAFEITNAFADFDVALLRTHPRILTVARQAVAPPMARDRMVTLSRVDKNLVKRMEEGGFPRRVEDLSGQLARIVETVTRTLDPQLFDFVRAGREPTHVDLAGALAVVSDRLARALADPAIRNRQEHRQKDLMSAFLQDLGFQRTAAASWSMSPETFVMGRNMPVKKETGKELALPVDCVICPRSSRPLLALEMKSAGDFTNVNKRRKEEATKHEDLKRTYGKDVTMLLQLFGYFDVGYLSYEAGAGIDWAWDHRLDDLAPHLTG